LAAATRVKAQAFVVLVSSHYLDSDEILKVELPHIRSIAQARAQRASALILAPCPWQSFIGLREFTVIPDRGNRHLAAGSQKQIKDDLHTLTREMRKTLQESKKTQTTQPLASSDERYTMAEFLAARVSVESGSDQFEILGTFISPEFVLTRFEAPWNWDTTSVNSIKISSVVSLEPPVSASIQIVGREGDFVVLRLGSESLWYQPRFGIANVLPTPGQKWHSCFLAERGAGGTVSQGVVDRLIARDNRRYLRLTVRGEHAGGIFQGAPVVVGEELIGLVAFADENERSLYAIPTADILLNPEITKVSKGLPISSSSSPDTLQVAFTPEESKSDWITQETFKRFSLEAVEVLSRASRNRGGPDAGRIHTGHVLQAFREQAAHGDSARELIDFIKANEAGLVQVLGNSSLGSDGDVPLLERPPSVSDNVRKALLTAIAKVGNSGEIEDSHLLYGVLSTDSNPRVRELNKRGMTPDKVPLPASGTENAGVPEGQGESIALGHIKDTPAERDALGFKPYVDAIASFLKSEQTKPPLTLSIEGEWGSGKSSFMLQLNSALVGDTLPQRLRDAWAKEKTADSLGKDGTPSLIRRLWNALWQRRFSIQFNPWRHDKAESLWAAFALEFLRQVSRERFFLRRWWGTLRLFRARYKWYEGWFEFLRAALVWIVIILLVAALPISVFVYKPHWATQMTILLKEKLNNPNSEGVLPRTAVVGGEGERKKTEAERKLKENLEAAGSNKPGQEASPTSSIQPVISPGEAEKKKPDEGKKDNFDVFLRVLLLTGGNAAYFAVVLTIWLKAKEVVGNPLEIDLKKYLSKPDYEGSVAFVERFHEDFRKIVEAYVGEGRVFVFVDDLDRCEVPKAAELIKAVNLLIADDRRLVFILGMDREKVVAGLAVKYEKLLPYLLTNTPAAGEEASWKRRGGIDFGQTFLQKFIQLPFRVPIPNVETYEEFIRSISGPAAMGDYEANPVSKGFQTGEIPSAVSIDDEPAPEPSSAEPIGEDIRPAMPRVKTPTDEEAATRRNRELQFHGDSPRFRKAATMFAQTLGTNPRRLIQFINLLRLQAYIVNRIGFFDYGADGGTLIAVEQLGKFVALGLQWPALLTEFAARPDFLGEIEDYANGTKKADDEMGSSKPTPPPNVQIWLDQKGMIKFLKYGMEEAKQNYTLKNATLYRLLSICPQRIKVPRTAQPSSPPMA